jgi:hypothetical protein
MSVFSFDHCSVCLFIFIMIKWKDRHYNDQMKRQTLQWSNEKTDITMIKWKDRYYNDQVVSVFSFDHCNVCLHLIIVMSVFSFDHCSVCLFITDITMIKWKDRYYNDQMKRQTLQWSNKKTDTTMIKWRQTLQWSNEKTDTTMIKWKDRHYNVVMSVFSFDHCSVCLFIWSL